MPWQLPTSTSRLQVRPWPPTRSPQVSLAAVTCLHSLSPPRFCADATAEAEAKDLTLERSEARSGFACVVVNPTYGHVQRPFQARMQGVFLGHFAHAEAAALAVAK